MSALASAIADDDVVEIRRRARSAATAGGRWRGRSPPRRPGVHPSRRRRRTRAARRAGCPRCRGGSDRDRSPSPIAGLPLLGLQHGVARPGCGRPGGAGGPRRAGCRCGTNRSSSRGPRPSPGRRRRTPWRDAGRRTCRSSIITVRRRVATDRDLPAEWERRATTGLGLDDDEAGDPAPPTLRRCGVGGVRRRRRSPPGRRPGPAPAPVGCRRTSLQTAHSTRAKKR